MNIPTQLRALFLSHGGGPLPLLGDPDHLEMVASLKRVAATIDKPKAIVVVSAHWEEPVVRITHSPNPDLIYDYYGFPEAAYQIQYPAPGAPDLAQAIFQVLERHNIPVALDDQRGFDHGIYIPLKIMYPEADIPCLQISLVNNLDPEIHIKIGEYLAAACDDGVLVIGSGFSFHNLQVFRLPSRGIDANNEAFEEWLIDTCSNPAIDEGQRTQRLINWEQAPAARYCHPREEHLLPLHVCYGMTKTACAAYESLSILKKRASIYFW